MRSEQSSSAGLQGTKVWGSHVSRTRRYELAFRPLHIKAWFANTLCQYTGQESLWAKNTGYHPVPTKQSCPCLPLGCPCCFIPITPFPFPWYLNPFSAFPTPTDIPIRSSLSSNLLAKFALALFPVVTQLSAEQLLGTFFMLLCSSVHSPPSVHSEWQEPHLFYRDSPGAWCIWGCLHYLREHCSDVLRQGCPAHRGTYQNVLWTWHHLSSSFLPTSAPGAPNPDPVSLLDYCWRYHSRASTLFRWVTTHHSLSLVSSQRAQPKGMRQRKEKSWYRRNKSQLNCRT